METELWGTWLRAPRCTLGTALALKQLPKASTTLRGFLHEFCVGLSLGAHAAIVTALGIGIESAESYSFLCEPVLHGDLIAFIEPKVVHGSPLPSSQGVPARPCRHLAREHPLGLPWSPLLPSALLARVPGDLSCVGSC